MRAGWNGGPLNLGLIQIPFAASKRQPETMKPNSETRGIYLARMKNGEQTTGFDARRVLAQRGEP